MSEIFFDTDQAEFRFKAQSVIQHLRLLQEEHDQPDLQFNIGELVTNEAEEITLPTIPDRLGFVIIALLEKCEGQVFCKRCGRAYEPASLSQFPFGAGTSPFEVASDSRVSLIDRLFRCPRRMHSMLGGKGFRCPAGHKLISAVTWIS
jgi:hypothetical protein